MDATILVVDDEPLIRFALVDLLEETGLRVLEAADADEAIGWLGRDTTISMVVTDIDMPGSMDGAALLEVIRRRWPPIKLIVVTGLAELHASRIPEDIRVFGKPIDPAELLAQVEALRITV